MIGRTFSLANRFLQFRTELGVLWRAFRAAETPLALKALMLIVPLYLLSPIDLIPDFIPFAGWIDDLIIVPMLVSWIISLLPQRAPQNEQADGPTIDGTARRL